MNITGFWMAIICLLIIIVQLVTHKFVKKVTNTYWFWLGIGSFVFIWLMIWRFVPDWKDYINATRPLDGTKYSDAITISRAYLLDICPFMGLLMPLSLILDPTRKVAKAAAPLALIGGLLIVFIQMPGEDPTGSTSPIWNARWIFMGDGVNRCYFIMHAFNMFLSIGVMLNTPKYGFKGYFSCVVAAAIYYSYVAIAAHILNCQWFVSGLNLNDWDTGEYFIVAHTILRCSPALAAGLTFPLCILICSGFMALKDFVFARFKWFKFGDVFSKKWYAWYDLNKFKAFSTGKQ